MRRKFAVSTANQTASSSESLAFDAATDFPDRVVWNVNDNIRRASADFAVRSTKDAVRS